MERRDRAVCKCCIRRPRLVEHLSLFNLIPEKRVVGVVIAYLQLVLESCAATGYEREVGMYGLEHLYNPAKYTI